MLKSAHGVMCLLEKRQRGAIRKVKAMKRWGGTQDARMPSSRQARRMAKAIVNCGSISVQGTAFGLRLSAWKYSKSRNTKRATIAMRPTTTEAKFWRDMR